MTDRLFPEWAVRSLLEPQAIRVLTSPFFAGALTVTEAETLVRATPTDALLNALHDPEQTQENGGG